MKLYLSLVYNIRDSLYFESRALSYFSLAGCGSAPERGISEARSRRAGRIADWRGRQPSTVPVRVTVRDRPGIDAPLRHWVL